jgi:ATP-dependent helicase/nuclease subunit B
LCGSCLSETPPLKKSNDMDLFVHQLAALSATETWRTKWVIVPSLGLGHTLAERLVLRGANWANLRFTTVYDLAVRVAGPAMAAAGIEPLNEEIGPALMLQLLLDLPSAAPSYFRTIAEQPAIGAALWSSVQEFRAAGLSANDITANAFSSTIKCEEFGALVRAYEDYLRSGRLADRACVLATARHGALKMPASDLIIEDPSFCPAPIERLFLDSLPSERIPAVTPWLPGVELPAHYGRFRSATVADTNSELRFRSIAVPADFPCSPLKNTVRLFRAAGKEAEVEEVFRTIQREWLPLDRVEIVCAQPGEYPTLVWEKAARHAWPVTLQMGLPGTMTRPVRALFGFCDWVEHHFPAAILIRLLQSGDVDPGSDNALSAGVAARILRRASPTLGRETYSQTLSGLATSDRKRAEDLDEDSGEQEYLLERAERAEQVQSWLEALLNGVPEADTTGMVLLKDIVAACVKFAESDASIGGRSDVQAQAAVTAALEGLAPLAGLRKRMAACLAMIREAVSSIRVSADRPRPGSLHVCSFDQAGCSGRTAIFVIGLEEGAVLPAGAEDPILLDDERRKLAPERLKTSKDVVAEALYRSLTRLASIEGRIVLSFSCRDLRHGRETLPSWILLNAFQLLEPKKKRSLQEFNEWIGEPVTLVPEVREDAVSDGGWWLNSLRNVGLSALPVLHEHFPNLRAGDAAERERASDDFTEFDGRVEEAGRDLDLCLTDNILSASRLEKIAECPFRFFLHRGLGINPLEDGELDPDCWLDPMTRGSLLHSIFAEFMQRLADAGRRPRATDRALLSRIADAEIASLRCEIPARSEVAFVHEVQEIGATSTCSSSSRWRTAVACP